MVNRDQLSFMVKGKLSAACFDNNIFFCFWPDGPEFLISFDNTVPNLTTLTKHERKRMLKIFWLVKIKIKID